MTNPTAYLDLAELKSKRGGVAQSAASGCSTRGGDDAASCGSAAGAGDLAPEIWEKVKNHSCYS